MNDSIEEKNDPTKAFYGMATKGKSYNVQVLPLQYVKEYMEEPYHFFLPESGDYRKVAFNFSNIPTEDGKMFDMYSMTERWIPRLVKYGSEPCTLERLFEDGWDIVDFGNLLVKAFAISG